MLNLKVLLALLLYNIVKKDLIVRWIRKLQQSIYGQLFIWIFTERLWLSRYIIDFLKRFIIDKIKNIVFFFLYIYIIYVYLCIYTIFMYLYIYIIYIKCGAREEKIKWWEC